MQKVFRIQDAQGRGMYRSSKWSVYSCPDFQQTDAHPSPEEDSKLFRQLCDTDHGRDRLFAGDFLFGFGSEDQLRSWLYNDEVLLWLHRKGFSLAIYEPSEAYVGNTQAVFVKDYDTPVETHNLVEYFNLLEREE